MRRWLANAQSPLVDVGGGTGRLKPLIPADARHICIDVDWLKLARYATRFQDGVPIYGDALSLPLRSGVARSVAFIAISHHLSDEQLDLAFSEIARVQAPGSTLFFLDSVQAADRTASRLLWRHDRGAYARTAERLLCELRKHFRVVDSFEFTILHRYFACRCQPF
jgi:SAM-dependent methyltransferase